MDYNHKWVLIADDDKNICYIISAAIDLYFKGLKTKIVYNGKSALNIIINETPSILILDMNMPIMDGFQLLRELQGINILIPTIVISGLYDSKEKIAEISGMPLESFEHLKKPFNLSKLCKYIANDLDK